MGTKNLSRNLAIILVYGRLPLVFGGMICAIAVMLRHDPVIYSIGVFLLFVAMSFDLVDGWFSARFHPHSKLAHLADRIMDKLVYSIVFPLIAVGMMWRFQNQVGPSKPELFHAIFVLLLCITVLVRDQFAHFMRNFALRKGKEEATSEVNRLRTVVAAPVGAVLYSHAFYIPGGPDSSIFYFWSSWLGNLPLRVLFFIEISFLIINFGSIAGYCRKYGSYCLDELCLGDRALRHRILSFFPNALTVLNAMMGGLAIFFTDQGRFREAYLLLIGAALFDKLDGAVARRLGLISSLKGIRRQRHIITFGGILDDLADTVSFCIAPAWMFYLALDQLGVHALYGVPTLAIAVIYTVSGITRLIYFTLDQNAIPGFFKGLPTPAAALFVAAFLPILATTQNEMPQWITDAAMASGIAMAVAAFLMNGYPLRYIHFGRMMGRHPSLNWGIGISILIFFFTPYFGHAASFYVGLYLLSPLITRNIDPTLAASETKPTSQ